MRERPDLGPQVNPGPRESIRSMQLRMQPLVLAELARLAAVEGRALHVACLPGRLE
jgi:hypothetical protein